MMKLRIIITSTALALAPSLALAATAPFTVVIDPGHGGGDHGTLYDDGWTKLAEKDVTLALAREVALRLRARGIRALLTRERDQDVSLADRTRLANKAHADAFISIHMNSTLAAGHGANPRDAARNAEGVETYILNTTTDASSRRLARLENQVISQGLLDRISDAMTEARGEAALILKDLTLDANLTQSKRLACAIQSQLVTATSPAKTQAVRDRGVKQALFHVLLGADMPSVLVEAGFLTHPRDRAWVISPNGRTRMALAITQAIDRWRQTRFIPASASASALASCKVRGQSPATY